MFPASRFLLLTVISVLANYGLALYDASSGVKVIDGTKFTSLKKGKKPFLMEFYSSGCGHCKSFVPEYSKAAKALSDIVDVYGTEDRSAMASESVSGYPTVKFYSPSTATVYSGARTADALIKFVTDQLKDIAMKKLGGKGAGGKDKKKSSKSDVIELTDKNFSKKVVEEGSKDTWLLEFYAPWCGHCKSLAPVWEEAATMLKGEVKVAKIDATEQTQLAKHFGIKGFPTVYLLPVTPGRTYLKVPDLVVDFEGARDAQAIADFARQHVSKIQEAVQITSAEQLENECSKGVCVVAFLPHILESKTKGREGYLSVLESVVKATYSTPVKYFWSQGGDQKKFENRMHLQFGWPAVVAINIDKQKFATHKGSFTEKALRSFLTGLMSGSISVEPYTSKWEDIVKVEPWDGKDAPEPPQEPEYDEL